MTYQSYPVCIICPCCIVMLYKYVHFRILKCNGRDFGNFLGKVILNSWLGPSHGSLGLWPSSIWYTVIFGIQLIGY